MKFRNCLKVDNFASCQASKGDNTREPDIQNIIPLLLYTALVNMFDLSTFYKENYSYL